MDPDTVLQWIRESATRIEQDEYAEADAPGLQTVAREMVERFRSLDEWLSKGGFAPRDWQRKEKVDMSGRDEHGFPIGLFTPGPHITKETEK